jgi:hypothetical protein
MKHQNRFRQQSAEEQQSLSGQNQQVTEFESVDKLLRHDRVHTPVPPSIASRLTQSLERAAASRPPWWRRLFGRT